MKTHKAKRVAIIIEAIMVDRLLELLEAAGVTGYSVLPVISGSGQSGRWDRDTTIARGAGMAQVICIVRPDRLDRMLEDVLEMVEKNIGVVTIGDCEVLRAERF